MENILSSYGDIQQSTKCNYETKHFREFIVDGVDVVMMGGFAIVSDGKVYDCDLKQSQIAEYIEINKQIIPLHSVELWRKYYVYTLRQNCNGFAFYNVWSVSDEM